MSNSEKDRSERERHEMIEATINDGHGAMNDPPVPAYLEYIGITRATMAACGLPERCAAPPKGEQHHRRRVTLFNPGAAAEAMASSLPLFICDKAMDALAITECGGHAMAFTPPEPSGALLLAELRALGAEPERVSIMLAIGADGRKSRAMTAQLAADLTAEGYSARPAPFVSTPLATFKRDRAQLADVLRRAAESCDVRRFAVDQGMMERARVILDGDSGVMPTGFEQLDAMQNGGLHAGLYVLAAMSGTGKTTLALQLAAQLAAIDDGGTHALFVTYEMGWIELWSKLLARHAAEHPPAGLTAKQRSMLTAQALQTRGDNAAAWRELLAGQVSDALGGRLHIVDERMTPAQLQAFALRYRRQTRCEQLAIFVDYLQIMPPEPPEPGQRSGDRREQLDRTVSAMKRLAVTTRAAVMVISSINRASYLAPLAMESLKESGGIEYSADMVLALDPFVMYTPEFLAEEERGKRSLLAHAQTYDWRWLCLKCLKNRYGPPGGRAWLSYCPAADRFKEAPHLEQRVTAPTAAANMPECGSSEPDEAQARPLTSCNRKGADGLEQPEPQRRPGQHRRRGEI